MTPSSPHPAHGSGRSFHSLAWEMSNWTVRTSMIMDGLGIILVGAAALSFIAASFAGRDDLSGHLLRLTLLSLSHGVLLLSCARILDIFDKFRNDVDPRALAMKSRERRAAAWPEVSLPPASTAAHSKVPASADTVTAGGGAQGPAGGIGEVTVVTAGPGKQTLYDDIPNVRGFRRPKTRKTDPRLPTATGVPAEHTHADDSAPPRSRDRGQRINFL